MLDILSMSFSFTGLGFLKDAGLHQMLRVSNLVFCGLLSTLFLKKVRDPILDLVLTFEGLGT